MLTRILLVLLAVTAGASAGISQPAGSIGLPEPCRAQPLDQIQALEQRKERLERAIAATRAASGKEATNAGTLSQTQADLLEVLFQLDCAKARPLAAAAPAAEPALRGTKRGAAPPAAPPAAAPEAMPAPPPASSRSVRRAVAVSGKPSTIEVDTYYATNRGRSSSGIDPVKLYDTSVSTLTYGRAVVSIPSTHMPGNLELPSIWRLQFQPDPTQHFLLKAATPLSTDDARREMANRLAEAKSQSLLVFVHGYNMTFAETAMRTAQLAYDLNFPGLPFFFSWPSAEKVTGYPRDAETAQISERAFDQVLDDLSQLPVTDIYLIAHSMGSRVVTQTLRSRIDRGKPTARVSQLLLAAPDINVDLFRAEIAPRLQALHGTQTTVYASSSDLALLASKVVNGYPRVGETADGVFVFPGIETIDASRASMAFRSFGHSYLTDSAEVLKDIAAIVRQKLPAKLRGLSPAGASPDFYWSLQ